MNQTRKGARRSLRQRLRERGNVLVITAVTTAVLAGLSAAAITATGKAREAAVSKMTSDQLQNCLIAGRQMLFSKLKVFGINPRDLFVYEVMPDGSKAVIRTGHLTTGAFCSRNWDDPATTVPADCINNAKNAVKIIRANLVGSSRNQVRDVANVGTATGTMGGQYYSVTMACEIANRQAELEFMFRYGI